jgi:hypothetical protein
MAASPLARDQADMRPLEVAMSEALDPLILDLVEWVSREPRTYVEVLDAWRTSCPRLTVWEDACDRGYLARRPAPGRQPMVVVTPQGYRFLVNHGRLPAAAAE